MPRTPKQPDGATGPAKPRRSPANKPNGHGGNGHISSEEVARRAYELYESRGGGHGADFDDWIEAEKQLQQSRQQQPPAAERRKRPRTATGA